MASEIITKNFSVLWKEASVKLQEVQREPNKISPNKTTLRYIIIKMAKLKNKEAT